MPLLVLLLGLLVVALVGSAGVRGAPPRVFCLSNIFVAVVVVVAVDPACGMTFRCWPP